MEENIEKDIKIGDIVELKSKHIGTIININEFRDPCMKYGIDIEGFNDIAFVGEEAILRKIEKQNNIDEDIEIEGFEGEKIRCSKFTEKVGQDYVDYKFEYENNLKVIEMFNKKLSEKEKLLELANNKINELVPLKNEAYEKYCEMSKELETYKKIAEKLALRYADYLMDYEGRTGEKNHLIPTTAEKLLDWARKEVENDEI